MILLTIYIYNSLLIDLNLIMQIHNFVQILKVKLEEKIAQANSSAFITVIILIFPYMCRQQLNALALLSSYLPSY